MKRINVLISTLFVFTFILTSGVNAEIAEISEENFPDWAVQVDLSLFKGELRLTVENGGVLGTKITPSTKLRFSRDADPGEKILLIRDSDFESTLVFNLKNWTVEVFNKTTGVDKPDYKKFGLEPFSAKVKKAIDRGVMGLEGFLVLDFKETPKNIQIKKEAIKKKDFPQFSFELIEGKFLVVFDKDRKLLYNDTSFLSGRYQFGIFYQYDNPVGWRGMLFGQNGGFCTVGGFNDNLTDCLRDLLVAAWRHDIKECPKSFFSIGDKTLIGQGPTLDGWYEIESETKRSSLWVNPQKWSEKYGLPVRLGKGWMHSAVASSEYSGTLLVGEEKEFWEVTLLWSDSQSGYEVKKK